MVRLSQKKINLDTGEAVGAIVFNRECFACGNEFEFGMVHVTELKGLFPLLAEKRRTWKPDYQVNYTIDTSEQVYDKYAQSNLFCRNLCSRLYRYYATKARNIENSTRRRKERRDAARASRPDPVCRYCHQPFKAKRTDAKYCSDSCRQNLHRTKKPT